MIEKSDINDWMRQRGLTSGDLARYLTALGHPTAHRTVTAWRTALRGAPAWLPTLLAQRDALCEIYAAFSVLADAQSKANMAHLKGDANALVTALNTLDRQTDALEVIFERYLTADERGLTNG